MVRQKKKKNVDLTEANDVLANGKKRNGAVQGMPRNVSFENKATINKYVNYWVDPKILTSLFIFYTVSI
jgi:hypothetical protein